MSQPTRMVQESDSARRRPMARDETMRTEFLCAQNARETTSASIFDCFTRLTKPPAGLPGAGREGARRATSDNCTPFQPIAVAPKHAATASKAASGQAALKATAANAHAAEAIPITPSRRRGGSQ